MAVRKGTAAVLFVLLGIILTWVYLKQTEDYGSSRPTVKVSNNEKKKSASLSGSRLPKNLLGLFNYKSQRQDYQINITRSLEIPIDRVLPITASKECKAVRQSYHQRKILQTVSVIIPFHAEHWTVVLRVLHCLLNTVHDSVLKQIILVDDANDEPNLGAPLHHYIQAVPKISLIRLKERHGLIKARMEGARAATGDVLVFMDAHVEMEPGWLEPLLLVISEDNSTVAVPTNHVLNPNSLEPSHSAVENYGSFTWELDFYWMKIPLDVMSARSSSIEPIPTATMIGCVFAMHRGYFFHLGGFDEGMDVWGGENLELSFRTWMCGGRLLLVPCSMTYHVYRPYLPYEVPTETMYKNLQRVAMVWMGDYKKHYFQSAGRVYKFTAEEQQSLTQRQKLKQRLKCCEFSWYLQDVTRNILEPPRLAVLWGQLKNLKRDMCLSAHVSSYTFTRLNLCPLYQRSQTFYFNTETELVHQESGQCLTKQQNSSALRLQKCKMFEASQTWNYNPIYPDSLQRLIFGVDIRKPIGSFWMRNEDSERLCLDVQQDKKSNIWHPVLNKCEGERLEQYWSFMHKINDRIFPDDVY